MHEQESMGTISRRWTFGWCEYIEISRALIVHGKRSDLKGKPLALLQLLLMHAETVVPSEKLLEMMWGNSSRQSLTVAISKLRKAFGGETDDIIQNVSGDGYRMAVAVHLEVLEELAEPVLHLNVDEKVPHNPAWTAVTRLGGPDTGPVWLTRNEASGEERVYKFAMNGVLLRTLQREETVAGLLRRSGAPAVSLRRLDDWNFSERPYYLAGEHVGQNLLLFGETDEFAALSRPERVELMASLCDAVAMAHSLGVLHNDLKPSNVLVRRLQGAASYQHAAGTAVHGKYALVLIDFGDSTLLEEGLGSSLQVSDLDQIFDLQGHRSATLHSEMYRAPELRLGRTVSVEADMFSLGIMLYQVVTGDFTHVPSAGWQQDVNDLLLEAEIARAAHRDPVARFRTAAAMAESLHSLEQRRLAEQERERRDLYLAKLQRDLDRSRAARPWTIAALLALTLGVLVSGWFYHSAVRERNLARKENRSLQAMLTFLSEDVLAQSNPGSGVIGSSHAVDLTLSNAILNAIAQIQRRFPQDPLIAGQLRETIADGLRTRTQFVEADQQYRLSAEAYRSAEGNLSQQAIAVELKRDAARLSGLLPDAVAKTRADFDQQAALIRQLRQPEPKVVALKDFVESGLIGLESDPKKAIPVLQRAVLVAERAPGFDPMLLIWIKGRLCGLYVRLQDGPHLEATAEDRIRDIRSRFGGDSPMLVSYEMYLEEAYFLEGKYREAIQQADRNEPRFKRLLGADNQYTLAVLATRAASLAQLGRYPEAVQNDLNLSEMEKGNPSGKRIRVGSLGDAALFSCRSHQFQAGEEYARQAMKESGPGPNSMPGFFNGATFALAECGVAEQEAAAHPDPQALHVTQALLKAVDPAAIAQQTGDSGYDSLQNLAEARVALLQGDYLAAAQSVAKTDAFFGEPGRDPYELQQYQRVKERLAHTPTAAPQPKKNEKTLGKSG